ncbi:MAG: putative ABC transporter permease [Clostridia bacterium]|nr:putative ABC transporter permease [Clostridia bacterium]
MFRKLVAVIKKGDSIGREGLDADHFARGRNFYKLFWVFLTGSLIGIIVETFWSLFVTPGHFRFEWRSGIILIPLNPVYGLCAVLLYVFLYKIKKKNFLTLFLAFVIGAISGSALEFFISFFQEKILGSVSWDYSYATFRIGNRICLEFALYWGLLTVGWVLFIRPLLDLAILKIPNRPGKPLTVVLFVVMAIFGTVSVVALFRWSARLNGTAHDLGAFGRMLDRVFNDGVMAFFYPNMIFV